MKRACLDASSAILLFKCELLEKLVDAYHLITAESVFKELCVKGYPGANTFAGYGDSNKVVIEKVTPGGRYGKAGDSAFPSLDLGERDTISCFEAGLGDFVITDDGKAAKYCRRNNIRFINALLFGRIAFQAGMLSKDEFYKKFEALVENGRYTAEIIGYARNCDPIELAYFVPKILNGAEGDIPESK